MTRDELARLQAWRRSAPVDEPRVVTEPTNQSPGVIRCDYCDAVFTAAQFRDYMEHVCDGLRAHRETL